MEGRVRVVGLVDLDIEGSATQKDLFGCQQVDLAMAVILDKNSTVPHLVTLAV